MEEDDHWDLKTKVKERDEILQGTKCEILLGLASILFTLIWKIKGSSHWKNYWSEELLETHQAFSEDHLEIKWKASCKYHGKQTWIKIKYFEESKSNVNTI